MRIGLGYDVHPLVKGRKLILGGVEIPFELGLAGHSDADVLSHAICDALLGAANAGDIGQHFSNSDPRYKDISSLLLLKEVGKILESKELKVVNIDSTLVMEKPRVAPYIKRMVENIARTLKIEMDRISIKATRGEGLGFVGRGEGAAAYAVACLEKRGD